jgi:hypothetical protein
VKNTADVTGGKPITALLQSFLGVSAINPLVAFYDIHGGKREVFSFVPNTRDSVYGDIHILQRKHPDSIQIFHAYTFCTVRRSNP